MTWQGYYVYKDSHGIYHVLNCGNAPSCAICKTYIPSGATAVRCFNDKNDAENYAEEKNNGGSSPAPPAPAPTPPPPAPAPTPPPPAPAPTPPPSNRIPASPSSYNPNLTSGSCDIKEAYYLQSDGIERIHLWTASTGRGGRYPYTPSPGWVYDSAFSDKGYPQGSHGTCPTCMCTLVHLIKTEVAPPPSPPDPAPPAPAPPAPAPPAPAPPAPAPPAPAPPPTPGKVHVTLHLWNPIGTIPDSTVIMNNLNTFLPNLGWLCVGCGTSLNRIELDFQETGSPALPLAYVIAIIAGVIVFGAVITHIVVSGDVNKATSANAVENNQSVLDGLNEAKANGWIDQPSYNDLMNKFIQSAGFDRTAGNGGGDIIDDTKELMLYAFGGLILLELLKRA